MPDVTPYPKAPRQRGTAMYRTSRKTVQNRSKGRCEARVAWNCTGTHEHTHHIRRRSQGGSDLPANLLAVCFWCHEHIHRHPAESVSFGFLEVGTVGPASSAVRVLDRPPYDWKAEA